MRIASNEEVLVRTELSMWLDRNETKAFCPASRRGRTPVGGVTVALSCTLHAGHEEHGPLPHVDVHAGRRFREGS